MSSKPPGRDRLTFLVIAIFILVFTDMVILRGDRPYFDFDVESVPARQAPDLSSAPPESAVFYPKAPDSETESDLGYTEIEDLRETFRDIGVTAPPVLPFITFGAPDDDPDSAEDAKDEGSSQAVEIITPPKNPAWQKYAVAVDIPAGTPKVVIILDDVGVNKKMSEAAIALEGPLNLAFLPYADGVEELASRAAERGHELMVHVPMEPMNETLDPGPQVLRTGLPGKEFDNILNQSLSSIGNYVGINNHMGSKLTQNAKAMTRIMNALNRRGLLFVDSKTIGTSVAGDTAAAHKVPYRVRDVFLDHHPDYESVMNSLKQMERIAKDHGVAVGIGHPKADTIRALYEWLPTLEGKGIALVPVSAVAITDTPALSGTEGEE
jgi:polysaccharide deacetylase 2 family uncharacterized protein YibQ